MTYDIYNTKRGGILLRVVTVKHTAVYSISANYCMQLQTL